MSTITYYPAVRVKSKWKVIAKLVVPDDTCQAVASTIYWKHNKDRSVTVHRDTLLSQKNVLPIADDVPVLTGDKTDYYAVKIAEASNDHMRTFWRDAAAEVGIVL